MTIGIFLAVYFLLVLVVGMPIAFCIGAVGMLASLWFGPAAGISFPQIAGWFVDGCIGSGTGLTIVLFMVTGDIMSQGRLTERIFNLFAYFFGKRRGFIPVLTIVTAMFYGAISGSSPATVAAVGILCYPMLVQMGYEERFSAGIIVCAGCLGGIIPPSTGLAQVSALTGGLDLTVLFKAAAAVGLGAGVIVCAYSYLHCLRRGSGDPQKISAWVDALRARGFPAVFRDSVWAVLTPVLILGSIFSGAADVEQAAAVSMVYGIFVCVFVYRSIRWSELPGMILKSLQNAGPVVVMVGFSTVFSNSLEAMGITKVLQDLAVHVGLDGRMLMVGLLFFMLVGGTIGAGSSVALLTPLVYPLIIASGMDPFVGCTAMVLMQCLGGLTPPIGMALFTIVGISKLDIRDVSRAVLPVLLLMFLWALAVVSFPGAFGPLIGNASVPLP